MHTHPSPHADGACVGGELEKRGSVKELEMLFVALKEEKEKIERGLERRKERKGVKRREKESGDADGLKDEERKEGMKRGKEGREGKGREKKTGDVATRFKGREGNLERVEGEEGGKRRDELRGEGDRRCC